MAGITVILKEAVTNTEHTVELPRDIPMSRLIRALITRLGLPIAGPDGQQMSYRLQTEGGMILQDNDTLYGLGIQDGALLILSGEFEKSPIYSQIRSAKSPDNVGFGVLETRRIAGINVILRVIATNTEHNMELPGDISMSYLIPTIRERLGLPTTNRNGQQVKYCVQTEGGMVLRDNETLYSAGIHDGALLIITSEFEINIHVWSNQDPISFKVPEHTPLPNFLNRILEIFEPSITDYNGQNKKYHLYNEKKEDLFEQGKENSIKSVGIKQ